MPSRRALLSSLAATATAGVTGCLGRVRDTLAAGDPAVAGPCGDPPGPWPTAGGDPGRTGRTGTEPPGADAAVVDPLAGVRDDGRQRLAGTLPVVGDGVAYVPTGSGIGALDLEAPADGLVWFSDLGDDVDAVPALACGAVLAAGVNDLVALDPETGEEYWRVDTGGNGETAVAVTGETVYVAGVDPLAVDARTGEVQWRADGGDTLATDDTGVYTTRNANGTGGIYAHGRDGRERWHLALGKIVGSATAHDGAVYVADNDGRVYAVDAATGETHWSRAPPGVRKIHSGLAVRGEDVVVPAGVGEQSVVLDAASGETRWRADTGIVTGRPVVGDDWVAYGRTNTGVTVYDRSTGEPRTTWSREEHDLGTIDGLAPVADGFLVRGGTKSGLSLIR